MTGDLRFSLLKIATHIVSQHCELIQFRQNPSVGCSAIDDNDAHFM